MAANSDEQTQLNGKVALVTGSSRGIGRSIASRLHSLGASIALVARDAKSLTGVAEELGGETGQTISVHEADVGEPEAAPKLVKEVLEAHGQIDILVNNAGGSVGGSLVDLEDSAWEDAFQVKLFGGMRIAREAWPALVKSKGSLINIGGAAGWLCDPKGIVAATQCGGIYAMTKSMAALGLEQGVQVNAINPGPVWTDRLKSRLSALGIDASLPEDEILEAVATKYKLRRIALPQDIANLVAFVLSPSGGVFHGALINFDGGAVQGL